MTQRDPTVRLFHMRDFARKAMDMARGRERDDLDDDEMFQLALTRLVELIGEAASQSPKDTREKYPQIPWQKITGMRHRLIHEYDMVDIDVL
ncbi:DUF86 domain-containing protein [Candidatus Poribacteria bacterium]|nr:DUF86 domain-containing protein [Candidatus Poribacteria bacterium]